MSGPVWSTLSDYRKRNLRQGRRLGRLYRQQAICQRIESGDEPVHGSPALLHVSQFPSVRVCRRQRMLKVLPQAETCVPRPCRSWVRLQCPQAAPDLIPLNRILVSSSRRDLQGAPNGAQDRIRRHAAGSRGTRPRDQDRRRAPLQVPTAGQKPPAALVFSARAAPLQRHPPGPGPLVLDKHRTDGPEDQLPCRGAHRRYTNEPYATCKKSP